MGERGRRLGWSLGAILLVGAVAGIAASWATRSVLDLTESNEFCVSCHVMDATVFEELKRTRHYKNRLGLQAGCADCHLPDKHIPAEMADYLAVKIGAGRFVFGWLTGRSSEPEQLREKRAEMAERVWATMRENDSRECRRCHSERAWDLESQTTRAREQHQSGREEGKTCIDCHDEGVAHERVVVEEPAQEGEAAQEGSFEIE